MHSDKRTHTYSHITRVPHCKTLAVIAPTLKFPKPRWSQEHWHSLMCCSRSWGSGGTHVSSMPSGSAAAPASGARGHELPLHWPQRRRESMLAHAPTSTVRLRDASVAATCFRQYGAQLSQSPMESKRMKDSQPSEQHTRVWRKRTLTHRRPKWAAVCSRSHHARGAVDTVRPWGEADADWVQPRRNGERGRKQPTTHTPSPPAPSHPAAGLRHDPEHMGRRR